MPSRRTGGSTSKPTSAAMPSSVYVQNGVPNFTFTGFDEHGKPNSFQFKNCEQVGWQHNVGDGDGGLCSIGYLNEGGEFDERFIECSVAAGCGTDPSESCFCGAYPDADECSGNNNQAQPQAIMHG